MESLPPLLFLLGVAWIVGATTKAGASSEVPDDQPDPALNDPDLSSEAEAAAVAPLPTLQAHLNTICEEKVKERCKTEEDELCLTKPVARKGKGRLPEQHEIVWRCYGNLSHAERKSEVLCIDSCGILFDCAGTVPPTSLHMTLPELEVAITDNVGKFCSPYQKALNDICNDTKKGWVARKGVLAATVEQDEWKCFDAKVLNYEESSRCLDNCGETVPCRGGRPKDTAASSLQEGADYVNIERAEEQLDSIEHPCTPGQVCTRTLQNPPTCVLPHEADVAREEAEAEEEKYAAAAEKVEEDSKREAESLADPRETHTSSADEDDGSASPPQDVRLGSPLVHAEEEFVTRELVSRTHTLSGLLGSYCLKEYDYLCDEKKISEFCLDDAEAVVARKDLGKQEDAERPVWRCVEKQKLDKSRSSVCVDACGQPYICPGGIDIKKTVHARWPQLELVVKEKASDECAKHSGGISNEDAREDTADTSDNGGEGEPADVQ